jgi:hypothetical protein
LSAASVCSISRFIGLASAVVGRACLSCKYVLEGAFFRNLAAKGETFKFGLKENLSATDFFGELGMAFPYLCDVIGEQQNAWLGWQNACKRFSLVN